MLCDDHKWHFSLWYRNHTECTPQFPLNSAGLSRFYPSLMELQQVSFWVLLGYKTEIDIKTKLNIQNKRI